MATQPDKESRGFEFPKGTLARLEEARRRHGDRSVNKRVEAIVLPWLDEDERRAALDARPSKKVKP